MAAASVSVAAGARPRGELPTRQLVQLSLYWFGINAVWGGVNNVILQARMDDIGVPFTHIGRALALMIAAGAVIAILVQPTVGALSDYTISRWGRRKPYILVGALLDVVFLAGIAFSDTFTSVLAFVMLLQLSSNFAQGPFQGYVPDLVPAKQVGLASGLMGLMIIFGRIGGVGAAALGLVTNDFRISTIGLGLLELATAVGTIWTVDEGRQGLERGGRSWLEIAASAWSLDILRQRNFLWLLGSRLFILMGSVALPDLLYFYLSRSLRLSDRQVALWIVVATAVLAITTAATTYPAARLSDRVGRKRVIFYSCAVGAAGMAGIVVAPNIQWAIVVAVPVGIAAGSFLAVDWALMTDIIPKDTAGRYMGISNVVTGAAGPLAVAMGGIVMDRVGAFHFGEGPRAAFALGLLFYAVGALLLAPVDERRRE